MRNFKLSFLLFVLCFWSVLPESKAQQMPLYSQYFENQFMYNPAWCGLEKYGSANLTYRDQWGGIPTAPTTMLFTLDIPFYEYRAGFGLNVTRDEIMYSAQTKAMLTYAYHIFGPYANSSKFSMGFSAGLIHNQVKWDELFVQHPNDPYLWDNNATYMAFEASVGLNYTFRNLFQIGVSVPQLVNPGLSATDEAGNNIGLVTHYAVNAKGFINLPDGYSVLEPSVMLRATNRAPYQLDAGIRFTYADLTWGSIGYRGNYAVTLAAGIKLERLRIGYGRDFATGDAVGVTGSTNELMIGYKFKHLPTASWQGRKGVGRGLHRQKVYHPSRSGPLDRGKRRKSRRPGYRKRR